MTVSPTSRTPAQAWAQAAVIPAEIIGWVLAGAAVLVQFVLLTALLVGLVLAPFAIVGALLAARTPL